MNNLERLRDEKRVILARRLDSELQRHWDLLDAALQDENPATSEHAEAIERISQLRALLPKPDRSRRWLDVIVLTTSGLAILACTLIRLPSTSVDLDILVSGLKIDLAAQHAELLIPGELGEILMLSQARVSQAELIQPPSADAEAILELRQLTAAADKKGGAAGKTFPIRLQVIALPENVPITMTIAMAYALNQRGLKLGAESTKPTKAQFGEVIEIAPTAHGVDTPRRAIRPIVVSGRKLAMDLFPIESAPLTTVFRDVQVSTITFEHLGESSVLTGQVAVKGGATQSMTIQPSDRIDLRSKGTMLLREVTFDSTGLRVKLTAPQATAIATGGAHSRNLMPTVFDWLWFRWPTQLWGTISALMAVWLAARRWWRPEQ